MNSATKKCLKRLNTPVNDHGHDYLTLDKFDNVDFKQLAKNVKPGTRIALFARREYFEGIIVLGVFTKSGDVKIDDIQYSPDDNDFTPLSEKKQSLKDIIDNLKKTVSPKNPLSKKTKEIISYLKEGYPSRDFDYFDLDQFKGVNLEAVSEDVCPKTELNIVAVSKNGSTSLIDGYFDESGDVYIYNASIIDRKTYTLKKLLKKLFKFSKKG